MNSKMIYFIIGLPGSGKTYWTQALGKKLSYKIIDLDEEIELQTGSTIAELFKINELHFREKEKEILQLIIQESETQAQTTIIATGGGTPCYFDNLELMKKSGKVIFLKSSLNNIIENIQAENSKRPLFSSNKTELLQQLLDLEVSRNPYYLQADVILNADNLTVAIFASILDSNF